MVKNRKAGCRKNGNAAGFFEVKMFLSIWILFIFPEIFKPFLFEKGPKGKPNKVTPAEGYERAA